MSITPVDLITAAKVEHYDDQHATNQRIEAIAKRAQALQDKIQKKQQAAQEALTAQVKPLQAQLDQLQQEANRLTAEFAERDQKRAANIEAWERVKGNEPSTD